MDNEVREKLIKQVMDTFNHGFNALNKLMDALGSEAHTPEEAMGDLLALSVMAAKLNRIATDNNDKTKARVIAEMARVLDLIVDKGMTQDQVRACVTAAVDEMARTGVPLPGFFLRGPTAKA